jgi:hypothetical protein
MTTSIVFYPLLDFESATIFLNKLKMRFAHINIAARDWEALADFYIKVFECKIKPPKRNLSGEWLCAFVFTHIAFEVDNVGRYNSRESVKERGSKTWGNHSEGTNNIALVLFSFPSLSSVKIHSMIWNIWKHFNMQMKHVVF